MWLCIETLTLLSSAGGKCAHFLMQTMHRGGLWTEISLLWFHVKNVFDPLCPWYNGVIGDIRLNLPPSSASTRFYLNVNVKSSVSWTLWNRFCFRAVSATNHCCRIVLLKMACRLQKQKLIFGIGMWYPGRRVQLFVCGWWAPLAELLKDVGCHQGMTAISLTSAIQLSDY